MSNQSYLLIRSTRSYTANNIFDLITKETAVIFHPRKDGDYSGFVFSEERWQTAFLQFGYRRAKKIASVQRDAIHMRELKQSNPVKY